MVSLGRIPICHPSSNEDAPTRESVPASQEPQLLSEWRDTYECLVFMEARAHVPRSSSRRSRVHAVSGS